MASNDGEVCKEAGGENKAVEKRRQAPGVPELALKRAKVARDKTVQDNAQELQIVKTPKRRPLTPDEIFTVDDFWRSIEEAWDKARNAFAKEEGDEEEKHTNTYRLDLIHNDTMKKVLPGEMLPHLHDTLATFTPARLAQWELHLTRVLCDLDSERIHRILGGNSETFLHKRAFVVSLGKAFFTAIKAEPDTFGHKVRAYEQFLYVGLDAYGETFGHEFWERWTVPPIGISRESFSNESLYRPAYLERVFYGCDTSDESEDEFEDEDRAERRRAYGVVSEARIPEDAEVTTAVFWKSWCDAWCGLGVHHHFPRPFELYTYPYLTKERMQSLANKLPVDRVMAVLRRILEGYTATQLQSWHNHLILMLYNLDREDLYNSLSAKDSTFLGYRFFIVACGKEYYDHVQCDPAMYATRRCVDYSWIAADMARTTHGQVYDEIIPLAARSNKAGWPTKPKK